MYGALETLRFVLREVLEAEVGARVHDRVVRAEVLDQSLRVGVEVVVGGAQVAELGLAAHRRYVAGVQHRVAAARVVEGGVAVPEAVAEAVHAATAVGVEDLAGLVQVGDVDQGVVVPALLVEHSVAVELPVQALGERELFGVAERLVVEDEHGVLVHAGANLGEHRLVVEIA